MLKPVTEHNRCWCLRYSDEVKFHLDTLPCVPEEAMGMLRVRGLGVSPELAQRAVAITDKRDPNYERISPLWPSSNPQGSATWFEQRAAFGRAPTASPSGQWSRTSRRMSGRRPFSVASRY